MFDIGWTEMLVIAVVMIVVVGPKDLPRMLRTFGRTTAKLRSMAGDFQKQFNEALKEAELDDVKKSVESLRSLNPANEIRKQLNPFEKAASDLRAGVDDAMKPKAPKPAESTAHAAEPLKNGAAPLTDAAIAVNGPTTMPPAPVLSPEPVAAPKSAKETAAKPPKTAATAKAAPARATKPAAKAAAKPSPAAKAAAKPAGAAKAKPAAAKAAPGSTKAGSASSRTASRPRTAGSTTKGRAR